MKKFLVIVYVDVKYTFAEDAKRRLRSRHIAFRIIKQLPSTSAYEEANVIFFF